MRRKFAMIAAFVVAVSGAIATKANSQSSFKTAGCQNTVSCSGSGKLCGYIASTCPAVQVQKSN